MLAPRLIDPLEIGKPCESSDALAILIGPGAIDSADVDGVLFPEERDERDGAPTQLHRQEGSIEVPRDATPIRSDVQLSSFAFALVGLLCATVIGFVSEIRPLKPGSPEYGYDEALGSETSSVSRANFRSSCLDERLATAAASKDNLDSLMVSATAAHAAPSSTATFTPGQ